MGRRARWWVGLSALALVGGGATSLVWAGRARTAAEERPDSTGIELQRLRRENRLLRMEVELAEAQRPYLVLDLEARRITLKSHGTPLREFPFREASLLTRRLLGVRGGAAAALDTTWGEGRLLPPVRMKRVEILADTVSPPDPSGTVAFIPPTPEEALPTPPTFRIRYAGDRSLLVRAASDSSGVASPEGGSATEVWGGTSGEGEGVLKERSPPWRLLHWLRMRPWLRDRLRVEVTLSPAEAGAMYRAYADGTPLMVLGPDPSSVEGK